MDGLEHDKQEADDDENKLVIHVAPQIEEEPAQSTVDEEPMSTCPLCPHVGLEWSSADEEEPQEGDFVNDGSIKCDVCNIWFHLKCVNLEEIETINIDKFHCCNCENVHGPSVPKEMLHRHRHEFSNPLEGKNEKVQNGTLTFIESLKQRRFNDAVEIVQIFENGHQVCLDSLEMSGFEKPIFVKHKEGLGLEIPENVRSVEDISNFIEPDFPVDVIDVQRQISIRCSFGKFLENFRQKDRLTQLNLISLEFNETTLSDAIVLPKVVEELSWVIRYWPENYQHEVQKFSKFKPKVSKFCLISMANSYTDFHIDFSGTSVWYHVIKGEKIFYFAKPTEENLIKFENWMNLPNHSEHFLADEEGIETFEIRLKPGQTLLIPSGWIHAVLTPEESLVYGGNFLHSFSVAMQLKVYEMECRLHTSASYKFPNFELTSCHAANGICELLKECNEDKMAARSYLIEAAEILVTTLKKWSENDHLRLAEFLNDTLVLSDLISELSKEIKLNKVSGPAQKFESASIRRSRRKRKVKRFSEDFEVDVTTVLPASKPKTSKGPNAKKKGVTSGPGRKSNAKTSRKLTSTASLANSQLSIKTVLGDEDLAETTICEIIGGADDTRTSGLLSKNLKVETGPEPTRLKISTSPKGRVKRQKSTTTSTVRPKDLQRFLQEPSVSDEQDEFEIVETTFEKTPVSPINAAPLGCPSVRLSGPLSPSKEPQSPLSPGTAGKRRGLGFSLLELEAETGKNSNSLRSTKPPPLSPLKLQRKTPSPRKTVVRESAPPVDVGSSDVIEEIVGKDYTMKGDFVFPSLATLAEEEKSIESKTDKAASKVKTSRSRQYSLDEAFSPSSGLDSDQDLGSPDSQSSVSGPGNAVKPMCVPAPTNQQGKLLLDFLALPSKSHKKKGTATAKQRLAKKLKL